MAGLLEELLKPISDASFCGEDASYEAEYEAARAEADKISENNFALMADVSRKLLTKKSKDMRALGYLVLGSAMSQGLDSFAEAVIAYCRLATEHWADIHPKRATARANALKWLNMERALSLMGAITEAGDYELLSQASEEINKFQAFCDGKFPEAPPSFAGFAKLVRDLAAKNKPVEKPPEPAPGEAAAAGSSPSGGGGGGGGGPAKIASIDDAYLALQTAGYYLLEQNLANPLAYRLNRMLKWEGIRELFPSDNGKTIFPAPQPHVLEAFKGLFQARQWPDLIKAGEETFAGEGGLSVWFDLQRFLCTALAGAGGDYAACGKAVLIELAMLLKRVPDLPSLTFDDGTPFADSMTKEWIQNDVMSALGGGGGGGMAPIKKKGDVGEEQKQADALLGEGKLEQAMQVLRVGMANDSSQKNNFDRKLIMAELCFKGNKPQIAKAILEDLTGVIERNSLSQWDVDLCVSVYHLAQKVYLTLSEAADEFTRPALRDKALAMHTQISKLNPVLAIGTEFK